MVQENFLKKQDILEFSVGYEGQFKEDYQDHTCMLNAKYKF